MPPEPVDADQASKVLGGIGLKPTPYLLSLTLQTMTRSREIAGEKSRPPDDQIAVIASNASVSHFGLDGCVQAVKENYPLAGRRVPLPLPENPSVQDVCTELLRLTMRQVVDKDLEPDRQVFDPGDHTG